MLDVLGLRDYTPLPTILLYDRVGLWPHDEALGSMMERLFAGECSERLVSLFCCLNVQPMLLTVLVSAGSKNLNNTTNFAWDDVMKVAMEWDLPILEKSFPLKQTSIQGPSCVQFNR